MRYYTYISTSKVESLFPQIPTRVTKALSAELGFNLGLISGKVSAEETARDSLVAKAQVIERHLQSEDLVGDLSSGKAWVEGQLPMRHVSLAQNRGVFLLVGEANEEPLLLAGSARHVMSGSSGEDVDLGYSYLPNLARELGEALESPKVVDEEFRRLRKELFGEEPTLVSGISDTELADVVYRLLQDSSGQVQPVVFLARRLFSGRSLYGPLTQVLTPLYVYEA